MQLYQLQFLFFQSIRLFHAIRSKFLPTHKKRRKFNFTDESFPLLFIDNENEPFQFTPLPKTTHFLPPRPLKTTVFYPPRPLHCVLSLRSRNWITSPSPRQASQEEREGKVCFWISVKKRRKDSFFLAEVGNIVFFFLARSGKYCFF